MRKLFYFLGIVFFTLVVSCGPSQQEQEKQKVIDDSLMETERDAALDNANALLSDTAIEKSDTIKK